MRSRRILVLSADPALATRLEHVLQATSGIVEVCNALEPLTSVDREAALCVLHLAGPLAGSAKSVIAHFGQRCQLVIIVPEPDIVSVVDTLQLAENVAAVVTARELDDGAFAALAQRILTGELFGAAKELAGAGEVHSVRVHDFRESRQCIAELDAFLSNRDLPNRLLGAVEQCIDEMLMNALYDAPVDVDGRHVFEGVEVRKRMTQKIDQCCTVEYGVAGRRLVIAVCDAFGSLERATVLRTLHKCVHADDKVDRKAGGAGVGLFLMLNEATTIGFHIVPGLATEAVCTFDLDAKGGGIAQVAILTERSDVTGALVTGRKPAKAMRPVAATGGRRWLLGGLAAAVLAVGVFAGVAMWRRADPDNTASDLPPVLILDSYPSGASVAIDGVAAGETPVHISHSTKRELVATFTYRGYEPAVAHVTVPSATPLAIHMQPLRPSSAFVHVQIVSRPPGARILKIGDPPKPTESHTYAPADFYLEVAKPHRFALQMPGYEPFEFETFSLASGSSPVEKIGKLTRKQE